MKCEGRREDESDKGQEKDWWTSTVLSLEEVIWKEEAFSNWC